MTKDTMNPKDQDLVVDGDVCEAPKSTTQQTKQHKKQVRRRFHTSRPYQEKLLNMAEARREIVTALKYHRATMKQASEQQQQQQQQQTQEEQQRPILLSQKASLEHDGRYKSKRNSRIYTSCKTNFTNYIDGFSHSYSPYPPPQASNYYTYPSASTLAPPPLMPDNSNFILPTQTLGLNLNFHDFNTLLDTTTFHLKNPSFSSSYSSPTSSSPPLSVVTDQEVPSALVDSIQSCASTQVSEGLHPAMDDEGMEEIRSLGEQYQMEWNDTMNLVKSACWFKFLKNMENGAPETKIEDGSYQVFEDFEFPPWLDANGSCLEQCPENYFQDSTLPCMDIGDIEGMDEDWLA